MKITINDAINFFGKHAPAATEKKLCGKSAERQRELRNFVRYKLVIQQGEEFVLQYDLISNEIAHELQAVRRRKERIIYLRSLQEKFKNKKKKKKTKK